MKQARKQQTKHAGWRLASMAAAVVMAVSVPQQVQAWRSDDGSLQVQGYVDNATHVRDSVGLSKHRYTGQMEFSKDFGGSYELQLNGTLRATYDAVYDLNDEEFGDKAGGPRSFPAPGNNPFFAALNGGTMPPPFDTLGGVPSNPSFAGAFGPADIVGQNGGAIPLPGSNPGIGGTPISGPNNPNDGLKLAAEDVYNYDDGGTVLATPVRPCDVDSRGCLEDYLDYDGNDLRSPEFNYRLDFLRELYITGAVPLSGQEELTFSFGRQQVVWGRTDLFRVLDVINPVDFARNNIFDELEDSRIPMGITTLEYRKGATDTFEDLNFQLLWKWEKFRPHNLGQAGTPYSILGIGNTLRGLSNCWDNGCTVWNFPATGVAVDFPKHSIGIRDVHLPDWDGGELGFRAEGVYEGVGFSANLLRYRSQLPSLRGGVVADDPFTPPVDPQFFPYNFAFDIHFPWITLVGGSADFYVDPIKTAFRLEAAYTSGEEFPDTSKPRLFSESDVLRWVIGIDRPTFIPWLNKRRAFLISAQIFGQHILDHRTSRTNSVGLPTFEEVGFTDWKDNYIATLLIQGNYMSDRLIPQVVTAWDFRARSGAIAPSVQWKATNNLIFTAGLNIKFGEGAVSADGNRTANIFPPATCAPPLAAAGSPLCGASYSSLGGNSFEPLGRFRSGPLGGAINEDEIQVSLRYQF